MRGVQALQPRRAACRSGVGPTHRLQPHLHPQRDIHADPDSAHAACHPRRHLHRLCAALHAAAIPRQGVPTVAEGRPCACANTSAVTTAASCQRCASSTTMCLPQMLRAHMMMPSAAADLSRPLAKQSLGSASVKCQSCLAAAWRQIGGKLLPQEEATQVCHAPFDVCHSTIQCCCTRK